jgi:hypothetical protein
MSTDDREDWFLDDVRKALEADPSTAARGIEKVRAGEIRLLCPKGDFIANIAVIDCGDDRALVIRPRGKDKRYYFRDVFSDTNHGFRFDPRTYGHSQQQDSDPRMRVRLSCTRRKCPYDGAFEYLALGANCAMPSSPDTPSSG